MDRYLKKFKDDSGRQGQEVKRFEYPDGTVQPSVSGQQTGKRKTSDLSQIEHDNFSSDEDPVIEKKNYKQKFRDSWLEEKSFGTCVARDVNFNEGVSMKQSPVPNYMSFEIDNTFGNENYDCVQINKDECEVSENEVHDQLAPDSDFRNNHSHQHKLRNRDLLQRPQRKVYDFLCWFDSAHLDVNAIESETATIRKIGKRETHEIASMKKPRFMGSHVKKMPDSKGLTISRTYYR
ncbi:hypothetical protein JTB14_013325 [Gonioctena quinquepunctata]|nr:hypothetical protein JTB14_013325 [Gonioctena quinquepunctata]